jgi:hypothetical protein
VSSAGREPADINFLSETAGDIDAGVSAIPWLFGFEWGEIFNLFDSLS